jgi:hypothetical protein
MRLPCLLFALLIANCLDHGALAASRRFAFVLGNASYAQLGELPNPANDAKAIAAALAPLGFEVDLRVNLGRDALLGVLPQIAARAREADLVAFFYAGHGLAINNENMIIPVDARLPDDQADLADQMVALARVMDALEGAAKATLIILDSCRNNPYNDDAMPRTRAARLGITRGLAEIAAAPSRNVGKGLARMDTGGAGMFVAFATKPGEFAYDAPRAGATNSPFSAALVHHLGTPGASLDAVMIRVRREVQEITERRQLPWSQSSLIDEEVFLAGPPRYIVAAAEPPVVKPAVAPTPPAAPPPLSPTAAPAPPPSPATASAPAPPAAPAQTAMMVPSRVNWDGKWVGKAGSWALDGTVENGELKGRLTCNGTFEELHFRFTASLASTRKVEVEATSISIGQIAIPRNVDIAGTFPELTVLSSITVPRYRHCTTETFSLHAAIKG